MKLIPTLTPKQKGRIKIYFLVFIQLIFILSIYPIMFSSKNDFIVILGLALISINVTYAIFKLKDFLDENI